MKSLQTILTESILGPEGPQTLEDNELTYAIYCALEALPKADNIIFDRLVYKNIAVGKKFCKTIMDCASKLIRTNNIDLVKRINDYPPGDPPGVAIHKGRGNLMTLVAWSDEYYIITSLALLPKSNDIRADYTCYWAILAAERNMYSAYFKNLLWDGGPYYYMPCSVNMDLVKKICDAKR